MKVVRRALLGIAMLPLLLCWCVPLLLLFLMEIALEL